MSVKPFANTSLYMSYNTYLLGYSECIKIKEDKTNNNKGNAGIKMEALNLPSLIKIMVQCRQAASLFEKY